MHDESSEFTRLDALIKGHPPIEGSPELPSRVMQRIANLPQTTTLWYLQVAQWLVTGVGVAFTLSRLFGYIFSAWLSVELAG